MSGPVRGQDNPLQRDIIVLVDQSKSVDEGNRQSALRLISGLVGGNVIDQDRMEWKWSNAPAGGKEEPPGNEETKNIAAVFAPEEKGFALAKTSPRHLLAGLGNYSRTRDLRAKLDSGLPHTDRGDLAAVIRASAPYYPSHDNSTHVILAESILAETLLKAEDSGDYYLIVISDFYEDCFNRPVSEYATPATPRDHRGEMLTLAAANALVHEGRKEFDDGGPQGPARITGKYSTADIAAIRFFREKVEQLKLGEFEYIGPPIVGAGKLPVRVRIYAHSPRRSVAFAVSSYKWTFPDSPPDISWTAQGVTPGSSLTLALAGGTTTFKATQAHAEGVPFKANAAENLKAPLAPGSHPITLTVADPRSPRPLEATATLEFIVPTVAFTGEIAASSAIAPLPLDNRSEIFDEPFRGTVDPAPEAGTTIDLTLEKSRGSGRVETVQVPLGNNGTFSVSLSKFARGLTDGLRSDDIFQLTASLPDPRKVLGPGQVPSASCHFSIPKINIWPEGHAADKPIRLKTSGIRFKFSHAGVPGYEWRTPMITGAEGGQMSPSHYTIGPHRNTITFDRKAQPGTYRVVMSITHNDQEVEEIPFTIEIPSKTPWMLVVLGTMGTLSLGLAAWYAFTRR